MNETCKCVCGEQECLGGAEVEIKGICHRPKNPCYVIKQTKDKETQDPEALSQEIMREQYADKLEYANQQCLAWIDNKAKCDKECDKRYGQGYEDGNRHGRRLAKNALQEAILDRIEDMEEKGYEEKTIIESVKNYLRFGV